MIKIFDVVDTSHDGKDPFTVFLTTNQALAERASATRGPMYTQAEFQEKVVYETENELPPEIKKEIITLEELKERRESAILKKVKDTLSSEDFDVLLAMVKRKKEVKQTLMGTSKLSR